MASTLLTSNGYVANSGDNTAWRAWGTALSNAFANSGWVQAADAGQINWSTVVANGSANNTQSNGFEIWRMNDALQSTMPCYIKIDYRSFYTVNSTGLVLQLGAGTDGSGNLTGATSNQIWIRCPSGAAANTWQNSWRGTSGDFTCVVAANTQHSAYPIVINIERTKDANGNNTAEGILFMTGGTTYSGVGVTWNQMFYHSYIGSSLVESDIAAFIPVSFWGGSGNKIHLYPLYFNRGVFINPALNLMLAAQNHVAVNSPYDITFYGATHRYVTFPSMSGWSNRSSQTASSFLLCMRWE